MIAAHKGNELRIDPQVGWPIVYN